MRRLLAVLLALAFVGQPVTAMQAGDQGRQRVAVAQAETLVRAGQPEAAIPLLDQVIAGLDAADAPLPEAARLLLRRGLSVRALAAWLAGERRAADGDLDRLVQMEPGFEFAGAGVPEDLRDRLESRREREVGELGLAVHPLDARVLIDDREVAPVPETVPLLEGDHVIFVDAPGHAPQRHEVRVRAGRFESLGVTLERASATIRIATEPPGARVTLDGAIMGQTPASAPSGAQSPAGAGEPLVIDAVLPGTHDLEVTLPDHRSHRQRLVIDDLRDYDLGTLTLEPAVGFVVLEALPEDAVVLVDGARVEPRRPVDALRSLGYGPRVSDARVTVNVGARRVRVTDPRGGVYEAEIIVGDGATISVDTDLRPGVILLGALGGDDLDRDAARDVIATALGGSDRWFFLDRSDTPIARTLEREVDRAWLRRQAEGAPDTGGWERIRELAVADAGAAIYVLGSLPPSGIVGELHVWILSADPRLPVRDWLPLRAGDPAGVDRLREAFDPSLVPQIPWFGAVVADSEIGSAPLVVSLTAGSPAALAGIAVGDEIVSIDGDGTGSANAVLERLRAARPFASVAVAYRRGEQTASVAITLASSPWLDPKVVERWPGPVVWAAAAAEQSRSDPAAPRWALRTQQAMVLMHARRWQEAGRILDQIQAPTDLPLGQPAIDYLLGVALMSGDAPATDRARDALTRAARAPFARLEDNDGPRVAPRARARLALLDGAR